MPYFLVVGEQFPGWVSSIQDGGRFEIASDGAVFNLFHRTLTSDSITCFREGKTQFGLICAGEHTLFLLYRIDGLAEWSDCFYALGMIPPERRGIPERQEGHGWIIRMALIDTMTGIIKALRACTVTPEFSRTLDDLVLDQYMLVPHFTWEKHHNEISAAHAQWSTPEAMLVDALIIEEAGCHPVINDDPTVVTALNINGRRMHPNSS